MGMGLTGAQRETLNQLRKHEEGMFNKRGQAGFFPTCVPELLHLGLATMHGNRVRITELGLEVLCINIIETGIEPML